MLTIFLKNSGDIEYSLCCWQRYCTGMLTKLCLGGSLKNLWSPDRPTISGSSQLRRKARYFLVPCLGSSLPLSASADPSARPVSSAETRLNQDTEGRQRRILPESSFCPHCRYLFLFARDIFLWLNPHGLERRGQTFQSRHNHSQFPQILPIVSGRMVLGRDWGGLMTIAAATSWWCPTAFSAGDRPDLFFKRSALRLSCPPPAPFSNCLIQNGDLGGEVELINLPLIFVVYCSNYNGAPVKMVSLSTVPPTSRWKWDITWAIGERCLVRPWRKN